MTTHENAPFEISGPGWSVSFQRRVTEPGTAGRSPNRGVLPYQLIESRLSDLLVMVPLPEREAIWVAVMLDPGWSAHGERAGGNPLAVTELDLPGGGRLLSFDTVLAPRGACVIDHRSVPVAREAAELGRASLILMLSGADGTTHLRVVLATSALFARVSGQAAPEPSSPEHSYGGWRLP